MTREDITKQFPEATKEQIDAIMAAHGADVNAEKAKTKAAADKQKELQTELDGLKGKDEDIEKVRQRLAASQKELDDLKAANAASAARQKVAAEKGIPADLLTAATEEDCAKQADALLAWKTPAKDDRYVDTHDNGGSTGGGQPTSIEAYKELAAGLFS